MGIRTIHTSVLAAGLVIAGLACRQPAQIDKTAAAQMLMDLERQAWAAIRDRQADMFKGLVTENFLVVGSWRTLDLSQKVAQINDPGFTLKEFAFSDMNVTFPAQDSAIVTYKATYRYVAGGQEGGDEVNCSSVWSNRENKWLAILHSEAVPAKD